MTAEEKHYTTHEVSRLCGVAPITVGRWVKAGKLKAFRTVGGHRRILARDLDAFMAAYRIPAPSEPSTVRKILVVDDDADMLEVTRSLLIAIDPSFDIAEAADGFEAGRLVATFRPHLVFLDLMMPGIDGFEVCRRLKADPSTEGVEIVGLTGYFNSQNRKRLMDSGAFDCLKKPSSLDALNEVLGRVFEAEE